MPPPGTAPPSDVPPGEPLPGIRGAGYLTPGQAYLVAIGATGLAMWFRLSIDGALSGRPTLVLFALPILLSAYLGGLRGGLLSTALAWIGASYYLLPPLHSFAVTDSTDRLQQVFMLLAGLAITVVSEALHGARRRAALASRDHARAEAALRDSEVRYRALFEYAPDGIVAADSRSVYTDANARICAMLGYTREELIGLHASDIVAPTEVENVEPALGAIQAREDYNREWRFRRKDGSQFDADVHATLMPDGSLLGVIRDVTERKQADARITRLNRLYAVLSGVNGIIVRASERDALFRNVCRVAVESGNFALAWITTTDSGGLRLPFNAWVGESGLYRARIESILRSGEPARSGMDRLLSDASPVVVNDIATDPRLLARDEALAAGYRAMVVLPLQVEGKVAAIFTLCAAQAGVFDEEEMRLLVELADDISFALEHIRKTERLDRLSYYDTLTGLANRSLFLERTAQFKRTASADGHKVAVVLMDLERFQYINESLGQQAGDTLLREVADWLGTNAASAELLARVGSDKFAIVMPVVRDAGEVARRVEQTLADLLANPFTLDGGTFRVSARFGVALFPDDGLKADVLLLHAGAALEKAKAGGEHYLFYTQAMTEAVAEKLLLENRLRHALEAGEFVLHYQPKLELERGRVTGAEALIRWQDPRTGLVPPGKFIPVLEATGLIHDVGKWALGQAVADYMRWIRLGLPAVRIAVNVSPLQLRKPGFVQEIDAVLGPEPDAANALELEITESLIMEDVRRSVASLEAIRKLGVTVAIDDFGTGFSSLAYLVRLPIDTLKIDRSFIIDMVLSEEGRALVATIVSLARSLHLKVVAEGVETEQQAEVLRALGCDEMQGFVVSPALPRDEFEARFLRTGAA